jgi:4'-phosphopantetheinyl transferase
MCVAKTPFNPPPKILNLPHDEVHIWRINAHLVTSPIETLLGVLTRDEREKAERLYFQKDRQQSVVARAALRDILSRYLHVRPDELRFRYGPEGKPELEQRALGEHLEFNLSHSQELILAAVCAGRRIGIDVEYQRPGSDWELIVDRFFSPFEIAALRAIPRRLRTEAFFHGWTRKEAYIKAKGGGLSIKLDEFDVSLAPGEPARLLRSVEEPDAPLRWWLKELFPAPGYAGAIAVEGRRCKLRYWNWE